MVKRSDILEQIAVQLKNLTKTFGSVVANKDVTLDIRRGEILSLLGENGSGKTTLMNMLSGIYLPDEGRIFVDSKEVSIRSPKDAYASCLYAAMIPLEEFTIAPSPSSLKK